MLWIKFLGGFGALNGALSVAMGAYASHGMATWATPYELGLMEKAQRYQMMHSIVLVVVVFMLIRFSKGASSRFFMASTAFMAVGILLFSGSLYAQVLLGQLVSDKPFFTFFAPFGGVAFIIGWCALALGFFFLRPYKAD